MSQPEVTPEDALQIAQRALQRVNELESEKTELEAQVSELQDRVSSLELNQEEHYENRDYSALSLQEKINKVRQHGFQKASDGHGKAKLDYKDIMWEVFDGEPGTKHCYKLIRKAAGLGDEKTGSQYPGFYARDPDAESYHLAVDASRAKTASDFFGENKTQAEGAN